ncbi:hypothetical protein MMC09_005187 [Bachmanniomyces sp. S44760]|nr:hypothetical protein [Bachmanniomyces sp. S44760]
MSHLAESQLNAFKSSMASSANKLSNKRSVAAPKTSSPSPAPLQSTGTEAKRNKAEPSKTAFSQPDNTGLGKELPTNIHYIIVHLKEKGTWIKLDDLLSYVSLQYEPPRVKENVRAILIQHDQTQYRKDRSGTETWSYKPFYNIRSDEQLLGHLQAQTTAKGLEVEKLKDGWPDCEAAIRQLEDERRLLVLRNKKTGGAIRLWLDDPSLAAHIDDEFKDIWYRVRLPEANVLADELEREQLTPTNKSRGAKVNAKMPEKKTKKPRKSGKTTNIHMAGVLRDYSHLKK